MKYYSLKFLFIAAAVYFAGCSEVEENITPPVKLGVHKEGISQINSPNFHGILVKDSNWDLKYCQQCHSSKYTGGVTGASCLSCHTNPGGPEACNTCHGDFADPTKIAPPRDLSGNINTSAKGVGAHSKHLYLSNLSNKVSCETCHVLPNSFYAEGHIDTTAGAEVILGELATAGKASNASYNPAEATCSNTYCHGNFEYLKSASSNQYAYAADKMLGGNKTVKWNKVDGTEAACGTCHDLPPVGHIPASLTTCVNCHSAVVDEQGNISDKTNHINGLINTNKYHKEGIILPSSENFHGKLIRSTNWNMMECQQCHGTNYAGGTVNKSCLTCHTNPGGPEACNTCHGQFNDPTKIAPPRDLSGNTSSSARGVGAHDNHLFQGTIASKVLCVNCHKVPQAFSSSEHIDATEGAEVTFSGLSILGIAANAFYNQNQINCSNTYCHGNFEFLKANSSRQYAYANDKMLGSNKTVKWTKTDGSEMACGTCHGLPPTGHIPAALNTCVNCHSEVIDAQGKIKDKTKHIDGIITANNYHLTGIITPSSPNFHGKLVKNNNWSMSDCQQCHGTNYAGGVVNKSCLTCHTFPSGPEACNTCHGNFSDISRIAPPRDLSGNTATSAKGVGAHSIHLYDTNISNNVTCTTCHTVPSALNSQGHIGPPSPSSITFKELAVHGVASNAAYNSTGITCANTYCHGNFEFNKSSSTFQFAYTADKMVGSNRTVKWNKVDGTEATCGSCHGLPPDGHIPAELTTCANCHAGVVDSQGKIVDKTKHINGLINVFGN